MLWSFIAVVLSGWLYVDASYRGPIWQRWLSQLITLLLLLALAWQAPGLTATGYLIIFGLLSTLVGSVLLILSSERLLYAISAFFLCHVLYTIGFTSYMTLTIFWPLPLMLLIIGTILIMLVWSRLGELRWFVCTYVGVTLLMVWVAGEEYFQLSNDRTSSLLTGTSLLLVAASLWLISHYRFPFDAARALIAACYFGGHFLIVRSLYL